MLWLLHKARELHLPAPILQGEAGIMEQVWDKQQWLVPGSGQTLLPLYCRPQQIVQS